MSIYVENTGVTGQEKQVHVPIANAEAASAPLNEEDTEVLKSQDEEPGQQINVVRSKERPDPLGRKIASLPMNAMKAGYDYAFGKGLIKH
jgi:hypothetical protein